jgi:WD40 repeat protein
LLTVCIDAFDRNRKCLAGNNYILTNFHWLSVLKTNGVLSVANSSVDSRVIIGPARHRVRLSIVDKRNYDMVRLTLVAYTINGSDKIFSVPSDNISLASGDGPPTVTDFSTFSFHVPTSGSTLCAFAGMVKITARITMM